VGIYGKCSICPTKVEFQETHQASCVCGSRDGNTSLRLHRSEFSMDFMHIRIMQAHAFLKKQLKNPTYATHTTTSSNIAGARVPALWVRRSAERHAATQQERQPSPVRYTTIPRKHHANDQPRDANNNTFIYRNPIAKISLSSGIKKNLLHSITEMMRVSGAITAHAVAISWQLFRMCLTKQKLGGSRSNMQWSQSYSMELLVSFLATPSNILEDVKSTRALPVP